MRLFTGFVLFALLVLMFPAISHASQMPDLSEQELAQIQSRVKCEVDYGFPTACEIIKGFMQADVVDLQQMANGALIGLSYRVTPEGSVMSPELAALAIHLIDSPPSSAEGQRVIEANIRAISGYNLDPSDIQRPVAQMFAVNADDSAAQDAIRKTLQELALNGDYDPQSDLVRSLQIRFGIDLYPVFSTGGKSSLIAQDNLVLLRRKGDWIYAVECSWITGARAIGPLWIAAFKVK
ncbi:MAG: hypothetical protein P9M14_16650 [Candidatus Alcyoniella australis]|nr:hypothetical protein [Candidatus Alcyoniella australis]